MAYGLKPVCAFLLGDDEIVSGLAMDERPSVRLDADLVDGGEDGEQAVEQSLVLIAFAAVVGGITEQHHVAADHDFEVGPVFLRFVFDVVHQGDAKHLWNMLKHQMQTERTEVITHTGEQSDGRRASGGGEFEEKRVPAQRDRIEVHVGSGSRFQET